jgi:hypothetical protein
MEGFGGVFFQTGYVIVLYEFVDFLLQCLFPVLAQ